MRKFPTLGVKEAGIVAAGSKRIVLGHGQEFSERDEGVFAKYLRAGRKIAANERFTWCDVQA